KKKILIVEDDIELRDTMKDFLVEEGFEVVSASDGDAGVQGAIEEVPDLVLLDIILPKRNGYEVLEEIKSNKKTKDIPVMVLTNLSSIDDIQKALDLGATNYLVKGDYKLSEVAAKIHAVLG
ncbi:response regulator transcription factor, partial [Patescibacteria group bacterium]